MCSFVIVLRLEKSNKVIKIISDQDIKILIRLRNNARMSLTNMSKAIKMPVSTIFERLRKSEETIINRHTCLINFNKLGYSIRANILIKLTNNNKQEFQSYIKKNQAVNNAYRVTNDYDYILECIFMDMFRLETFKNELTEKFKINKFNINYILDDVCREKFMTNPILENPPQIMI